jgi:hypothetical protein
MNLPWKCPVCGTIHTHPVTGCDLCSRAVLDEESDPIFRLDEPEDTGRPDHRRNPETAPTREFRARWEKRY